MMFRDITGNVGLRGTGSASFISAPGQIPHPLSGQGKHVDTAAVVRLRKNFANMKQQLVIDGVDKIRAEFGAYMYYSWWQERGTHNKDGSWKLRPRPHIVPAVLKHYRDIINAHANTMIRLSQAGVNGQQMNAQREIINSWIRILNGPVAQSARVWARALGVFEFGFHIRSIHGYASVGSGILGPTGGGRKLHAKAAAKRSIKRASMRAKGKARKKLKGLKAKRGAHEKRVRSRIKDKEGSK